MGLPLPGMNPYLESPELWSEFHSRLIVAIADALDDCLSQEYRVAVEKRVYLDTDEESILVGIPDVSIVRSTSDQTSAATLTVASQPQTIELPMPIETQERYLEIREVATGKVMTAIELLSPKNKRTGAGRTAYLQKRQQVLASATHLVEIDLLRGGKALPMIGATASDYRILISRSPQRPHAQLYPFNLKEPIPALPIPLRPEEAEPRLQLKPLIDRIYDRARFALAIDYRQPCVPRLSMADERWLQGLVELLP